MKKIILSLTAIIILLTGIHSSKASALTMSAGVYTWYAWWDFPEDTYEDIDADPSLMYGPALSVKLNETFSLSFLFLYGNFNAEGTDNSDAVLFGGDVISNKYDIDRYDIDTALNVKMNRYIKFYLGIKYSAFKYDLSGSIPTGDSYSAEFDHNAFGPGAGLSVVLPLYQNLYIMGNFGGLYLWGKEDYSNSNGETDSSDIKDYGYNTSVSLVYYIAPASTTISLGGRYQYIKTEYEDGFKCDSKFYGITLSAIYTFSI
ncbi:MAG TPA: Lpg1974 family pore-forming outer membrane protein [Spirochaetota bacterium]|nr:Lpg1974 family pore-forming outer membrane protein [Spirochaetota bacterium]